MLKKLALTIIFFFTAIPSFANTSSHVEVRNNVSSNSNSSLNSTTSSHTDITVETNGKVTHYESDKPGSVSVKSTNGESSIKVNGVEVTPNVSSKPETSASPTATNKDEQSKEMKEQRSKEVELRKNLIEQLKKPFIFLQKFFFFLH